MKNKIALAVYPYFSLQEIANLTALFRWNYDSETVVFASKMDPVKSEEGLLIQPHMAFKDFVRVDYDCLILSGCSDFTQSIKDEELISFLRQFKGTNFPIGAICAGPMYLAKAGLLDGRKFTISLYVEIIELFSFINAENIVYEPVVTDGPYITAVGFAFNEFAVAVARALGYDCEDKIFPGVPADYSINDFKHHLDEDSLREFKETMKDFF